MSRVRLHPSESSRPSGAGALTGILLLPPPLSLKGGKTIAGGNAAGPVPHRPFKADSLALPSRSENLC
jgi:hypothetical protein